VTPWDLPEKFRARIRVDESGCWHYTGPRTQWGYGVTSGLGDERLAHRVAYALASGPIPSGYQVDHLCRIHRCCNPEHLEAVTPAENRRRSPNAPENRTHCPVGHAYDEANTHRFRDGRRGCRACMSEYPSRRKAS
jgi:hypothetical protein